MKDTHWLYGIGVLAVLGILACFIGYATDTLPMSTPRQQAPVVTASPAVKPKACGCCAERMERLRKTMQRAREQKRAAQKPEPAEVSLQAP